MVNGPISTAYDVIIIGAGVIGCATAFELAKKGYRTLNIEKNTAAGYGSTANTCAIIRLHYSTYEGVKMAYEGSKYWENWEAYLEVHDELGLAEYHKTGAILLKTRGHDWQRVLENYRRIGIDYQEWDLAAMQREMPIFDDGSYWPPLRPEDDGFWDQAKGRIDGAIYTPGAGHISDPILSTHNLQRAAEAKGAEFLFNRQVIAIRRNADRVQGITLDNGDQLEAPVGVNIAGPHSFVVNRMAGVEGNMRIKTRALRHEVHYVPAPIEFDFQKQGCFTSDGDLDTYFRPEAGNTMLIGSEDPECDPQEWIENPDEFNREVTSAQWKAQVYRVAKRIPNLTIPTAPKGVVDLYDVSDDWIPIYDRSDLKGYYMGVGTSGNQYKNAGVAGFMLTELIDACEQGHDHDRDPLRITGPYTGIELNVGFFSRLRKVNTESSFSVKG